jgi:hypothetical protein
MNSWGDRIDSTTLALMSNRKVAPFAGRRSALVAIDLYDLVYDGGPRPVRELMEDYPSSCGEHAGKALPPTIELYETARRSTVPGETVPKTARCEPSRVNLELPVDFDRDPMRQFGETDR